MAVSLANFLIYLGVSQGSLSVFYRPLIQEFGWSRGSVATVGTLILMIQAFLVYFIGAACDRFGPRRICTLGITSAAVGFFVATLANQLYQFYGFSFFLAFAESALGFVPIQVLVSYWFLKHRGLATGIATAGISLGGILGPILTTAIIETSGWRTAFLLFGIGCLGIATPLVLWLVRNRPQEFGLWPDGRQWSVVKDEGQSSNTEQRTTDNGQRTNQLSGLSLRASITTITFWTLTLASTGMFYAIYGIAQHWVLFMTDRGLTAATAAKLLTIYYSLGVIGRFVWGPLFDKYSSKGVGLTLTTIMAAMVALLTFSGEGARSIPYLYAIIFGFCYGGFIFMKPLLIAEYFGTQSLGKVLGVASAITAFLSSLAPAITGFLFDLTKSYHLSFVVATAMAFFAVLMLATVRNEVALMRKE